ncbi:energy-coupling factor transporter transmembrane protein EcfT [Pseudarthrobacter sp. fls2-241-R2A-127]|uniref:energy-coupling factor transporter transmembrane component T n=1 Tax=Pseudarthrobacter sp. fls2-241-R2A-127 TaxID=3040303 RepID=UPI002554644C|nr:energy-coupling factor transporter transmembrane protein EcfT [Pseudarthrobacter sp. fls2-241-R2A-127]
MHDLAAETKLACLLLITIVMLACPGWTATAAGTGLVLAASRAARVPTSAIPRLPGWAWVLLAVGAATSYLGHGISLYLQSMLITGILLACGSIVAWTTPVAQIAPAVARLASPLRTVKVPVDEWALVLGLCLRSFPLLLEEFRIMLAARRLRRTPPAPAWRAGTGVIVDVVDLLTVTTAVSIRRAAELGQAITIRGGLPTTRPQTLPLKRTDWWTLCGVSTLCILVVVATTVGLNPA